jgi:hypothetical protein
VKEYNEQLYRGGEGWLPARLNERKAASGDESNYARPFQPSFTTSALDIYRDKKFDRLDKAVFVRWWDVMPAGNGQTVARFRIGDSALAFAGVYGTAGLLSWTVCASPPFLVEKAVGPGRVLLCTALLDRPTETNLPNLVGQGATVLMQELCYYLAGGRHGNPNVQQGQPLVYRLNKGQKLDGFKLKSPSGTEKPLAINPSEPEKTYPARLTAHPHGDLLTIENQAECGTWELSYKDKERRSSYFVIQTEPQELNLAPSTEEERKAVGEYVPFTYSNDPQQLLATIGSRDERQEIWWWLMLGVVALLCGEVWMTRRIVKNR